MERALNTALLPQDPLEFLLVLIRTIIERMTETINLPPNMFSLAHQVLFNLFSKIEPVV